MFSILLVAHFLSLDKKDGEDILNVFVKIFQKLVRRGVSIEEREILSIFGAGHRREETVTVLPVGNEGASLTSTQQWSVSAQGLVCDSRPAGPGSHHNYLPT